MGLSLPHVIILALVVLVLFGRGRISEMMGDFGKGIKSFKEGMGDEAAGRAPPLPPVQIAPTAPLPPVATPAAPQPAENPPPGAN